MAASTTAYTAGDGQLLEAALFTRADGGAVGDRVLHVAPSGGLHARVLVDRGLDLDRAWFAGVPVSWTSASGPRRAGPTPLDDDGWNRA